MFLRKRQLYFANVCKQLKSNLTICGLIEKLGGETLAVQTVEEVYKQVSKPGSNSEHHITQ